MRAIDKGFLLLYICAQSANIACTRFEIRQSKLYVSRSFAVILVLDLWQLLPQVYILFKAFTRFVFFTEI